MSLVRISLMALMLVNATYSLHLDQYETHEDGYSVEATDQQHSNQIKTNTNNQLKRTRRYYPWPVENYWQPQVYQIARPYYIPVWSNVGHSPVYYPPQPIRPTYDNRNYLPPRGYLPPSPTTTTQTPDSDDMATSSTPNLENRFNFPDADDNTDYNRPIYSFDRGSRPESSGNVPARPPPIQTSGSSGNIPTRPPPIRSTVPPLVHKSEVVNGTQNNFNRPPPSLNLSPPVTTTSPSSQLKPKAPPSRCVFAIISCCSAGSSGISYNCFEQLGCPGAFWGPSPCSNEFAIAAIDLVAKYYDTNK